MLFFDKKTSFLAKLKKPKHKVSLNTKFPSAKFFEKAKFPGLWFVIYKDLS